MLLGKVDLRSSVHKFLEVAFNILHDDEQACDLSVLLIFDQDNINQFGSVKVILKLGELFHYLNLSDNFHPVVLIIGDIKDSLDSYSLSCDFACRFNDLTVASLTQMFEQSIVLCNMEPFFGEIQIFDNCVYGRVFIFHVLFNLVFIFLWYLVIK